MACRVPEAITLCRSQGFTKLKSGMAHREGTRAGKGRGTRGGRQHQKGTAGPNMQEEKEKEAKRKGNEGSKVFDSFDLTRQVK